MEIAALFFFRPAFKRTARGGDLASLCVDSIAKGGE
jgi:hypothetical protein